jgi:SAM-dependent methyltransferase
LQAGSIWRDLSRLLPECRGVILHVGCGAQPYRGLIHRSAVYRAIDSANAERHFGYRLDDTIYYEGDRWPVADASVNVVLSTETLEHVANPSTFLSEAFRCVKPGGKIILTVPFSARWHYIPYDYWRFTPSGLERLLSIAGFRDVMVLARGNAVTVACYKVMALIVPLLFGQSEKMLDSLVGRAMGIAFLPVLLLLAAIANLSLLARGGADCLGYTAVAVRGDVGRFDCESGEPKHF